MAERTIISRKDLAARWGVSLSKIDRLVDDNVLHPRRRIGLGLFSISEVENLECGGLDEVKNFNMSDYRRQKAIIQSLRAENAELKRRIHEAAESLLPAGTC